MPFLTEELWQKLPGVSNDLHNAAYKSADATIMLADFPKGDKNLIDERAESGNASRYRTDFKSPQHPRRNEYQTVG